MPFSNGNFSIINTFIPGTTILSSAVNENFTDVATGLSTTILKNGTQTVTADIPFGAFGVTDVGWLDSASPNTVASAGTTDILGSDALIITISGTATITSLGNRPNTIKFVRASGAFTLTNSATLILGPAVVAGADRNITAVAGDTFTVISDASGNAYVWDYKRQAQLFPGSTLVTSGTMSGATTDIVLTASNIAYRAYRFLLTDVRPATDGALLYIRFSTDGGSNYIAANYAYANTRVNDGGTSSAEGATGAAFIVIAGVSGTGIGNNAVEAYSGEVILYNPSGTVAYPKVNYNGGYYDSAAGVAFTNINGGGANETAQDIDAVRFLMSSGNITSGNYAVYGLL